MVCKKTLKLLTNLLQRYKTYNFGGVENRMICDKIAFTTSINMQQLLSLDDELDLGIATQYAHNYMNK